MTSTLVTSFVVRFYCDQDQAGEIGPCSRVAIRHVQSGEGRQFHTPAEALAYLEQMAEVCTASKRLRDVHRTA